MDTFNLGYIMGLIVGEGCFTGDKKQPRISVHLHEIDPEPLLLLQSVLGGRIHGPYHSRDGRHSRFWVLHGIELRATVRMFHQHLPVSNKRRQFEKWIVKYNLTYLI